MRLAGKKAVITGAAGDIGEATARLFLKEGAGLALIDRDEQGLGALHQSLGSSSALVTVSDVTDEHAIRAAADKVGSSFGQIDILFVNAGIEQAHTPLTDMAREDFERVVAVNLTGAFLTAKHFLPLMANNGSVIFTSSTAALMPLPAYSAYSASKTALIGLMRSASSDVGPLGIRCNTVHPGPVRSRMLERSAQMASSGGTTDQFYASAASMARLGSLVEPGDVAALVLFLASDESRMVTGQSIAVDGGVVH